MRGGVNRAIPGTCLPCPFCFPMFRPHNNNNNNFHIVIYSVVIVIRRQPMFPEDPGEEEVRSTVHGWKLTRVSP